MVPKDRPNAERLKVVGNNTKRGGIFRKRHDSPRLVALVVCDAQNNSYRQGTRAYLFP
jgi:hypothetical protein